MNQHELLELLAQCEVNNDYFYTFVYVLSTLESYLLKNLAYLSLAELRNVKIPLVKLLRSKLSRFNLIKVSKLLSIILFHELLAYDEAFGEIVVNLESNRLEFVRIFLEEFNSNAHINEEQRQHIFKCLLKSAAYILAPLAEALGRIPTDSTDLIDSESMENGKIALKLFGQAINIFPTDVPELALCVNQAVKIATNLNQKNLKLCTLAIESLTELLSVTHITRRKNTLVWCYYQ